MRIRIGLAALLAVAVLPLSAAHAADKKDPGRDRGMKEAPALVQAAGYACAVADATYLGQNKQPAEKGAKPVTSEIYEVACEDGTGFIFGSPTPPPLDCMKVGVIAAQQAAAKQKVSVTACRLPANADPTTALTAIARKAGVSCTIDKSRWVGESTEQKFDQYEIGCTDGQAHLLAVPQAGSTAALTADNCLVATSRGMTCEYFDKAAALAQLSPLAAKSGKACQVSDARIVGAKASGGSFYEFACQDGKTGFMVETDPQGGYVRAVDCAQADIIGGGCTLTQTMTAGATEDIALYSRLIKEVGYPCQVSSYRSLGVDPTNKAREVVELACTDHADGAFALLPLSAGGAKGETYDCVRAEARAQKCKLTQKELVYPKMTARLQAKGVACPVRETRGIGQSGAGADAQDVLEVACNGGPGYVVIFDKGAVDTLMQVTPCDKAANIGGGCKIK